ncbi:hypothetical protein GJU94_14040 [Brucella sp. 10RB9214]|uniref:hypothetical protein n=1 Tax=unclassified Brucella TaxID=2632610 RepID=UPI000972E19E|nr:MULTISPECIES: hypothetical protein [unclassified Brucella]APY14320.1 hypothetical protein BKD02_08630 [Brucella sp. 09RB8910]MRN45476.1 hypothetical protein [Brucella sp. 10RB9212]MRN50934.1 hypothetical protein [Brucella sp. 10RB9214]
MKALVGAACVAIIAFVVYFFWGEYQRREQASAVSAAFAAQQMVETQRDCDEWVVELRSWKSGHPEGKAKSFVQARDQVDRCLNTLRGTSWADRNNKEKYW